MEEKSVETEQRSQRGCSGASPIPSTALLFSGHFPELRWSAQSHLLHVQIRASCDKFSCIARICFVNKDVDHSRNTLMHITLMRAPDLTLTVGAHKSVFHIEEKPVLQIVL